MAGPFSQRWTLEEHTPRETGGMQGRQASVTFYKCACLPPLLIASTLEAWHHHSQPLVQRQMEIRSDGSALPSVLA